MLTGRHLASTGLRRGCRAGTTITAVFQLPTVVAGGGRQWLTDPAMNPKTGSGMIFRTRRLRLARPDLRERGAPSALLRAELETTTTAVWSFAPDDRKIRLQRRVGLYIDDIPTWRTLVSPVRIGDVDVERVLEWVGPIKTVDEMFPDTPPAAWSDVDPQHWTRSSRAYRAAIQTWILRSGGAPS